MAAKKQQTEETKPGANPGTPPKPAEKKDGGGPTLTEITAAYLTKKDLYDKQHGSLTKRIESAKANLERVQSTMTKAELALSQLAAPSVSRDLVNPLARELQKLIPDCAGYEVIGPVGIQQAITISFAGKGVSEEDRLAGKSCRSITLVTKTENGGIGVRDYSKDTKSYQPGSIGYASGLNHPVIPVPDGVAVKWLLDHVK